MGSNPSLLALEDAGSIDEKVEAVKQGRSLRQSNAYPIEFPPGVCNYLVWKLNVTVPTSLLSSLM